MAETWLWVITLRNIFGISLKELKKSGKMAEVEDWDSIPSIPFEFHLEPPEIGMESFFYDRKVFLAGGFLENPHMEPVPPPMPSSKFYRLLLKEDDDADNNNKKKIFQISEEDAADSIPPPPTPVSSSFVANIRGRVYLLVHNDIMAPRERGLWVLSDDGKKEWTPLEDPPPRFSYFCDCFVLQDKLFIRGYRRGDPFMYFFDTRTLKWTRVEDKTVESYALWMKDDVLFPSTFLSSLPDVSNCSVALTYSIDDAPGEHQVTVKIDAMLVNKQDHSVIRYQSLDDCSKAILMPSFYFHSLSVKFVDLGEGLVCALMSGDRERLQRNPVLCVVVFALSLAEDFGIEPPRKEQRFLSVNDVYVSQVFSLKDYKKLYDPEDLYDAFIFPSIDGITHLLRRSPGSDPDSDSSSSPNPAASKTPKDSSPKVVEHKSQTSSLSEEKEGPSEVQGGAESKLAQIQEELKRTKDQLKEVEEAKRKQHAMDSAALESAKNEIQRLKIRLERSEAALANNAKSANAEIQELRMETKRGELENESPGRRYEIVVEDWSIVEDEALR